MFLGAQEQLYTGMIIGEHSRDNDLEVNPLKGKKLTNVRASGTDEAVRLTPPVRMSLEEAIAYINDDELVEVTPKNIRLRKRYLDPHERKRQARAEGCALICPCRARADDIRLICAVKCLQLDRREASCPKVLP